LAHPKKRDVQHHSTTALQQTGEASWIAASQPFCSSLGLSRWTPFCVWGSKPRALHLGEDSPEGKPVPAKGRNILKVDIEI